MAEQPLAQIVVMLDGDRFFRMPARRNPRHTRVTTEKNDERRRPRAYQSENRRIPAGLDRHQPVVGRQRPTATARNNPGALQREAIYICLMERSVSCLVDCR